MRLFRSVALAASTAALFGALLWAAALAQTDAPAPAPTPELEPSAYLTLDMQAGFALDPFLVSLNGGGEVDAATLDPACVGYVNNKPVLTANWQGAVDVLRVFFYSDSDSTLVIQQPDGSYVCADDAGENLLDAEVTLTEPMTGSYKVWVGSYDANQIIPGLLVITARPDLGLTQFDPSTLVRRAPIAPTVQEPPRAALAAREAVTSAEKIAVDGVISSETTLTATLVASGDVPSFEIGSEEAVCGGMIADVPDFVVEVQDGVPALRITFEAEKDTSLVVVHGETDSFCADDGEATLNANPVLDIETPDPGYYAIYVGRFFADEPITGTLTVTTDPTLAPAILAPAANPQS